MDGLLFPIIMLALTLLGGGAALLVIKASGKNKKKKDADTAAQRTANEFINVKDVRNGCLYTSDGWAKMFVRLQPISTDLLSKTEKRILTRTLTAELSDIQYPYQFLAASRPVDISPVISAMSDKLVEADEKQKELLRQEIVETGNYALSGEIVERQFYVAIWDRYEEGMEKELRKKAVDFASKYAGTGIPCDILTDSEIIQLCNLIHNPSYTHLEDPEFAASIPLLALGGKLDAV